MRKELFVHFAFLISFMVFVSLFKRWLGFSFWPFWLGGALGTLLPDIDHFLYVYFLGPTDLTSQRVNFLLGKREVLRTLELLAQTRYERTRLIFHTAIFQIIFFILTFLVVTSSGSLFGKGLVLAFSLHLVIDQLIDLMEIGSLANWFRDFPVPLPAGGLDKEKATFYWLGGLIVFLVFGFIF